MPTYRSKPVDQHPQSPSRASGCLRRIESLRCAYFGASESAARYGVSFDRVVRHLWVARGAERHVFLRAVTCVDDLVHAAACVDNINFAWADLAERYERALVRKCQRKYDEVQATILVRRLFASLRQRTAGPMVAQYPCLRCYSGTRPLRSWLTDRLNAVLALPPGSSRVAENVILEMQPECGPRRPREFAATAPVAEGTVAHHALFHRPSFEVPAPKDPAGDPVSSA
jgi:hypothetical protein